MTTNYGHYPSPVSDRNRELEYLLCLESSVSERDT